MFLLPFLFGLIFILTLTLKLLGGAIAWWIVIVFGTIFIVPFVMLVALEVLSRTKNKKS